MKKYLIGNIKMNMDKESFIPYFEELKNIAENSNNVVGVCVPSCYMCLANKHLNGSKVRYGTQNFYYQDCGAYTGEVSAKMLKDFNCDLMIIGHSERRNIFKESDEEINLKVKKALAEGFTPIFCFGESLEQRENNEEKKVVENQIISALQDVAKEDVEKIIFAYEPIWAIGTGKTATSAQAEDIIAFAKNVVRNKYNIENVVMLYGGSMKPSNAMELLSEPSIDGGLIGGACLKTDDFKQIIDVEI